MRTLQRFALAAYAALALLVLVWEAWFAPATPVPRAFWIGVKLVPLLLPLPWLLRGSAYAHVVAALLLLLYFCEGVATAYHAARTGAAAALGYGLIETAATVAFIVAASFYARLRFRAVPPRAAAETES